MDTEQKVVAKWSGAHISPLKARLVARLLKGMQPDRATSVLEHMPQKSAFMINKVLKSAIANAENNLNLDIDEMVIDTVRIDQARQQKRVAFRARGRRDLQIKRYSHISVYLKKSAKAGE